MNEFAQDCAELLRRQLATGTISRRGFLLASSALGLTLAAGSEPASAADPDVVMANWGGDAERALGRTFVPAYERLTGRKMVMDGSGPSNGKIRAMVEAKAVTWDVCDCGMAAMSELGPIGMLQPMDYGVIDKSRVFPGFAYDHGVCNYLFSIVMAWDTKVISGQPTLADFFDLKKYPGKRSMKKDPVAMMEVALMADGIPPDQIYPLDRDRALKKIATIKNVTLFWANATQSQSLLRDGEVVMGLLWNTRATVLKKETEGRIDWSYRQGFLQHGCWVVPTGNPAGKQAMVAIAAMQDPEAQVELFKALNNGPANPQAAAMVQDDLKALNPGAPENAALQAKVNPNWYLKDNNYAVSQRMFLDMISG